MEAAVTLVGFAASLVTLTAVVGDSARTVHNLWTTFRDSPTNLKRLSDAIAENEALLKDMQAVSDAYERVGIPDSLISRWKSASSRACDDFRELNMEMSKILECTKGGELTKKHLRRRVRHFFSEKAIESRCQQLTTHKADMSYIHLLMHSSYSIQIGEKLQSFGPDMETFRQESLSKLEGLKDSLEATQTDLVQAVQSELNRCKNSGAIQQAFTMVTDQSIAQGTPSCVRDKGSESPLHCPSITKSRCPCLQRSSGLVHAVEWHSHKYCFPIGTLQVEHVESVDVEIDEGEDASVRLVPYRSKKFRFIFQPPRWFSSLIMKIDIAMQIAHHGCTPSITWASVPNGRHLEPLLDELHEVSNLTLDRKLLAIARIGELDYLFEEVVSYCLGISYSDGRLSQKQRDARPIADALEQGLISFPGGDVGSRFLNKMAIRIGWTKNNEAPDGEQSRADMQQTLSQSNVMKIDAILSDNARGYLSETQRAVRLTSNLIDSGAQLPASLDFTSILMTDYGLWYLQCICPTLDITEVENLSLPSQWIFACLVRTVRPCYESVLRQLQGFPVNKLQRYTSTQHIAGEINSSQGYSRHRFLLSLINGGSLPMLEPLLFHGLSMGDLSTYYLEIASRRGRTNIAQLLWRYGASLSLATSNQLLQHIRPDLKTLLRDPSKSETFCGLLTQILDSFGPLQEIGAEHALFDSLVPVFQEALLLSIEEQTSSTSNSAVIQLLLKHSAFSSLETSVRVLEHIRPDLKTLLRDPRKSKTFCHFLAQVLESCGPLHEVNDEHAIFESLVLIFQQVLLLSIEEQTNSTLNGDIIQLFLRHGAFLSPKTSTRLLEHMRPHFKRFLRDPSKSETFCNCLAQVLDSCGPLQELDDEHPLFESLVLLFQQVLLLSSEEQTSIASNSDDGICNRIIGLLLEAGLFRDSKLPARYWSFHDLLCNNDMNNSPLMLAIYVRNVYAVKLLLQNGYDVDEVHRSVDTSNCMENRGTPLTFAVWLGFIEAVTLLLLAGADVTKFAVLGQTATEMSGKCLSLPTPRDYKGIAEFIDFKDRKDEHSVRRLIFNMVCADLEAKHGMQYNQFIDTIYRRSRRGPCLRYADRQHTTFSRYWEYVDCNCAYCPKGMLGVSRRFAWGGFSRKTKRCPCLYCLQMDSGSGHSPLPKSWERIVAPCKCSFIVDSDRGFELSYMDSDGFRYTKPCPLGNGDECCLRVLYVNHVTGEATLHCPCATCSPDWKGVPCLTLGSLFGQDESRLLEEIDDPLIPAQDLTRVGEPCWRLGDLFNDDKTEDLGNEDDPIIPAQGLHIFDDMPGFALAKNHRPSATQEVPLVTKTPKSQPTTAEKPDLGSPDSRATAVLLQKSSNTAFSTQTFFSLFVSYIVTRSTPFTDIPRPVSGREVMEVSLGLSLSVLLVIIYECISIYTYIKDLPRPPPFLSKLVLLVLVALGLRALKGNFGLV